MTFNELNSYIADELNLSSQDAKARIERTLNVRYKQVTSAIGLIPSRRQEFSKVATASNRYVTFTGVEKLDSVYRKVGTKIYTFNELTVDEMEQISPRDEPPTKYAIFSFTPTTVTVWLDCTPANPTTMIVYAMGLAASNTLTNTASPAIPESFHDILIHGVLADEYRRKEKEQLSRDEEQMFTQRLSDLRLFIAKSAYLDIFRGKHAEADGWWDTSGSGYIRR